MCIGVESGGWSNNNVQIDKNDVLGSGLLFCFCFADLDRFVCVCVCASSRFSFRSFIIINCNCRDYRSREISWWPIQTNLNKLKLCVNGIFMLSTTKANSDNNCMLFGAAQHFLRLIYRM